MNGTSAAAEVDTPAETTDATPSLRVLLRAPAPLRQVRRLVDEHAMHPLVAATLWTRGVRGDLGAHLRPALTPVAIPALAEAAARLQHALEHDERILVHGDYDADGICATAILTLGLRALGANVTPYVPDRLDDGYGLQAARVPEHAARADLLVTVDCGISSVDEVAALRAAGTDVIVTDHHRSGAHRPDALIVHPDDGADSEGLTGAGLAFHLVWALHERLGLATPPAYSDLAAIGTVADVAPLLGANRALVRSGLEQLERSERPGLRSLVALTKLRAPLRARQVAFVIAPRLNAAGRMGRADEALELLLTADERRARVLATLLEAHNDERRRIQETMLAQAASLAEADSGPALVLHQPQWHPGVMGIVAAQLLERFDKPVFIVADGKGSVRAPPGVSATGVLEHAARHLLRWGGHAAAAGFAIDASQIDAFKATVNAYVAGLERPALRLLVDALLQPDEVDADLYAAIEQLEPFGEGHEEPLFAVAGRFERVATMGNGSAHLQVTQAGLRGVGWGLAHLGAGWRSGALGLSVATLAQNTWRERTSIELRLRALVPTEALRVADASDGTRSAPPPLVIGSGRPGDLVVQRLDPRPDDPLAPLSAALAAARAGGPRVALELGSDPGRALRRLAADYPTLGDARRAFVARARGRPALHGPLGERLEQVLLELDLVDERGRARAGRQVDPYSSATLRTGLVTRHALEQLATLLETLDPSEAATAIEHLVAEAPDPDATH